MFRFEDLSPPAPMDVSEDDETDDYWAQQVDTDEAKLQQESKNWLEQLISRAPVSDVKRSDTAQKMVEQQEEDYLKIVQKNVLDPERRFILTDFELFRSKKNAIFVDLQERNANSAIDTALHGWQEEGLEWMVHKEKLSLISESYSGSGLLADDMGLGKTLMILSLVETHRPPKKMGNDLHTTLVLVTPVSLVDSWLQEARKHTDPEKFRIRALHGTADSKWMKKTTTMTISSELDLYDVVVTSYPFVHNNIDLFSQVHFRRIVLDEADDKIRNPKTKIHRSVCALHADFRWCLTGTPINNSLHDLHALIRFLKFEPFDNQEIWDIFIMKHPDRLIYREQMCSELMLRRTKEQLRKANSGSSFKHTREVEVRFLKMHSFEREVYDDLLKRTKKEFGFSAKAFNQFVEQFGSSRKKNVRGIDLKDTYAVLERILRMRQCCDHAMLLDKKYVKAFAEAKKSAPIVLKKELKQSEFVQHLQLQNQTSQNWIVDDTELDFDTDFVVSKKRKIDFSLNNFDESLVQFSHEMSVRSAKIKEILSILNEELTKTDRKVIVFTQWTSMLEILETALQKARADQKHAMYRKDWVRIDGSQKREERVQKVRLFRQENTRVLIATTGSCQRGLNLAMASRVIITEPWWNPQIEEQAMDRVDRADQTENIKIYRLICEDSIEKTIFDVQERKSKLATDILNVAMRN